MFKINKMSLFYGRSIRQRFIYSLIFVITIVMLLFFSVVIFYNVKAIENDLQNQLTDASRLAEANLPSALWDYNNEYVNDFVESLFFYKDVVFVRVITDGKIIKTKSHSEFQNKEFSFFKDLPGFTVRETKIDYNKSNIGLIQIAMTRSRIKNLVIINSTITISLLILIIFAIILTNLFLTKKYLFAPLLKLEKSARLIADGNFEAIIDTSSSDEIGNLAKTFEQMIKNIKSITASRNELNNEIQKRITTESALRQERDRAQNYLDIAGVMMLAIDKNHKVTLINKKGCEILGLSEDQILGKDWFKTFIPGNVQSKVKHTFKQIFDGKINNVEYFENEIFTGSNEKRIIAWHNTILKDENGKIYGALSSGEDITERKNTEDQINNSLKEKEVLLREIHHRVKNNMQIIQSLLNLQSDQIDDENYKKLLIDSNNRIRSMSLIHETLYRSKDVANLDIKNYFHEIIQQLLKIYYHPDQQITIDLNIELIKIDMDRGIACGLIINELISNALKYAFNEKSHGIITVVLNKINENDVVLKIMDDGRGFTTKQDIKNQKNLGLKIVDILVKGQLKGNMDISNQNGTIFEIKFPLQT